MKPAFYETTVRQINGKETSLSSYKGKVLLVVNVASKCGLTPQYEGLESLYKKYHAQGFEILGFPANEFLAQEPGTNAEIQQFCQLNYGVTFPMFEKIIVKGTGQHPLYAFLTQTKPVAQKEPGTDFEADLRSHGLTRENPSDILWNFEKFLIGKNGEIVGRFSPDVKPESVLLTQAIESALRS
jgi:glutathione peroxidase